MRITTEIYRLGLVFSVPAMLLAAFPYRAIGFKAAPAKARPAPGCRIVELTEAEEREALARARTSWATDASDLRKIRLDLVDSDMTDPGIGELVDYTPPKWRCPRAASNRSCCRPPWARRRPRRWPGRRLKPPNSHFPRQNF